MYSSNEVSIVWRITDQLSKWCKEDMILFWLNALNLNALGYARCARNEFYAFVSNLLYNLRMLTFEQKRHYRLNLYSCHFFNQTSTRKWLLCFAIVHGSTMHLDKNRLTCLTGAELFQTHCIYEAASIIETSNK
jgi:hypothetical protein